MSNKIVMTKEGRQKVEEDLKRMRGIETRELLTALSDAREKGDLSENSEYDVAKEAYEMHNMKIQKMEQTLVNAVIIDPSNVDISSVQVLTTVKLLNIKNKKEQVFTIVPSNEINLKEGKISLDSPMGKSLIGKKINEDVSINVPNGIVEYKILEISI